MFSFMEKQQLDGHHQEFWDQVSKIFKFIFIIVAYYFVSSASYIGQEPLIDCKMSIMGQHKGPKLSLAAGFYNYEFSFKLPDDLPSSLSVFGSLMSGKHGEIRYIVQSILDKTWQCQKFVEFKVVRHDDLNLYPELMQPLKCVKIKNFFSWKSDNESLKMEVSIPYRGLAIKQQIPLTICLKNDSSTDITRTSIKFIRVIHLVYPRDGNPKKKKKENLIFENFVEGVKAKNSKSNCYAFVVPEVLKSNDKYCKVVCITYLIRITAEADGMFNRNGSVDLPVTIGDTPLRFN